MNMKLVKKLLVATLATSLVVMPITAFATTDSSGDNTSTTVTTSSESSDTYVAPEGVKSTSEATIGGKTVKSTVSGSYAMGKTIKAAVFTQSVDGIKAAAGLKSNEKPFARVYESDAKKSPKALEAANGAATTLGVTLLSDKGVYIDLGKMTDGKFSSLDNSVSTPVTVALSGDAANATTVIAVGPNGVIVVIEATNDGKGNVTFEALGGAYTYYFA